MVSDLPASTPELLDALVLELVLVVVVPPLELDCEPAPVPA
jgi:hypothetical protein